MLTLQINIKFLVYYRLLRSMLGAKTSMNAQEHLNSNGKTSKICLPRTFLIIITNPHFLPFIVSTVKLGLIS